MDALLESPLFFPALCILCYQAGLFLQKKTRLSLMNPTLLASLMVIGFLYATKIPLDTFDAGSKPVSMLLGPATVVLAVPMYRQRKIIRQNLVPILAGTFAGAAASMGSVLLLCRLLGFDETMQRSLVSKSTTTAIALEITETLGGMAPVTVAAVIFTGMCGAVAAPLLIRLFRIKNPIAAGLAVGTASHAIGTSKAVELGETEGAFSGIAIGVAGLLSVALVLIFT